MICDDIAQIVWGVQALTASYADDTLGIHLDTRIASSVLWTLVVTAGGVSRADLRFFYTMDALIVPGTVWVQVPWTSTLIVAGTAQTAIDPREYLIDCTGAVVPFRRGFPTHALGRWMKVQARAGVGSGIDSEVSVYATRYYANIVDPGPV